MAGTILERELRQRRIGRVEFRIASPADDVEIRRLLRENPMSGRISISLEREPDYFADANPPAERKQTIIARDGDRVVCAGSCCVRKRFVNGAPREVGYLGGLRLDAAFAGRFDILRRGYEFFVRTQADAPSDFYFTSIASDNARARNFLERGFPGMPLYEFVGEFVTILIPVSDSDVVKEDFVIAFDTELTDFINRENQSRQFAVCLSKEELEGMRRLGLGQSDFLVERDRGQIAGCGALWDQRSFKQSIIRDYAPLLKRIRPVINTLGRVIGQSQLPAIGTILSSAYACHVVAKPGRPDLFINILRLLRRKASRRGIGILTAGFAANDPRLPLVRKYFRFREYRSRMYVVRCGEIGGKSAELDARPLAPEVALL
ncbi:MAG TPA: hypothetical protein VH595_03300 [Verrucomicrobiae bacterium]|jgi:hypothetical protein|nr:hypothetical protein [Verrucomicrobiae bacterium]